MTFPVRLLEHVVPPRTPVNTRIPATLVDRLLALDVDQIRHLWDPQTCLIEELPYLAWALSVDVWDPTWPETRKRSVVANAFRDHARKGTLATIETYLGYRDAVLKKTRTPPGKAFAGESFTETERQEWLKHYPQLRIYAYRGKTQNPFQMFAGVGHAGVSTGPKRRFLIPTTAPSRAGRRATLVENGVETELNVTVTSRLYNDQVLVQQEIVHLKDYRPYTFTAGAVMKGRRFLSSSRVGETSVTIQPSISYGAAQISTTQRTLAVTGLTPIDPTPIEVYAPWTPPPKKFFIGKGTKRPLAAASFLYPSLSFLHIYDLIWLYRPGIDIEPHKGQFFAGVSRLGIAAYTAELKVQLRQTAGKRKMFAGGFTTFSHAYPNDPTRVEQILDSVSAAKSLRDRININFNCTEIVRAGANRTVGSVTCGEQVETV